MKAELYLRYIGQKSDDDSSIPLSDLGNSLVAFERIVTDLGEVFRIDTKIEVLATAHEHGSHIVDILLQIKEGIGSLPFDSPEHLLEFLKLTSNELWQQANAFFNDLKEFHRTVNDWGNKHSVDITLLAMLIPGVLSLVRKQRHKPIPADERLSERIAKELYRLIEKNRFGSFVQPIAEDTVKAIDVSTDRQFRKNLTRIDSGNFEDYMGKDTEVLPDLEDGQEYKLRGVITSLKSTRGDSLTFQLERQGKSYNLDVFPQEGKTTKSYVQFYRERVDLFGRVERTSLYKKPKLHMADIALVQSELDLGITEP